MITVAIPVYNGAKFIKDAVNSVLSQTKRVDHILIVDDASSDNSIDVVQNIKAEHPTWDIQYYRNDRNLGYPSNWNNCFKFCTTKYLMILHQDDMLKKGTVKILYEFLQAKPHLALAGGYEDFVDEHGRIIRENPEKETRIYQTGEIYEFVKNHGSYIACSSVMFDMDKIRQVGYFDTDVIATDELYWPKVLQYYSIAVLGESLINRRRHSGQTEYSDFMNKRRQIIEWGDHFKKVTDYEKRPDKRKELKKLVNRKIANGLVGNIFISCIKYHKSMYLALFYLINGIKVYPKILLELSFWKRILKGILLSINSIIKQYNNRFSPKK
jgi:glycosyltransferase involved in cell wall biosynthesis